MDILLKYFPGLTELQISQFQKLEPFYREWNKNINLISRNDLDNLYERHVLHSLAIAKVINLQPDQVVLDVGTGGGFPGIPLAIFFPDTKFHLVDSIGKKIKVVNALIEELNLKNVLAEQARAENLHGKYDVIVSRAVTTLPSFVNLIDGKIIKNRDRKSNGIYYLKGGDVSAEIDPFKHVVIYDVADFFREPYFETKLIIHIPADSI